MGLALMPNEAGECSTIDVVSKPYAINPSRDVSDLKSYLSRPVLVSSGSCTASAGTLATLSLDGTPAWQSVFGTVNFGRMEGVAGFRCTLKFELQVTASAFNQGVLALSWQYGVDPAVEPNYVRAGFLPYVVNLPHARLNVASETVCFLEVPFVNHREYIEYDTFAGSTSTVYGVMTVTQLTGCPVVAGQDLPAYKVYVSMHDVELIGAAPFVLTSANLQSGIATNKAVKDKTPKTSSSSITKEAKYDGLVSKTLETGSKVARALSYVPALSAIGGTADWMLGSLAKTARAFGYSEPMDETVQGRVSRNAYAADSQIDVPSNGYVLSPFQSNKVNVGPELGLCDEDEMAFENILTRYQYIYRGQMSTSLTVGTVIYSCPLTPSAMWYRDYWVGASQPRSNKPLKASNALTENAFLPSTLCYVGDSFRVFRGGFKFRITFAKTKLHGGKVALTYAPTRYSQNVIGPYSSTSILASTGNELTGPSMIIDLRDNEVFEFEVPYISSNPYTDVNNKYGDFSITVLQPLRGNGTVSSAIEFMVEVCALPGFEFACPVNSMFNPVPFNGNTAITYQSGLAVSEEENSLAQQAIGEKFNSVKQLIMIPDYYSVDVANGTYLRAHLEPWCKINAPALATPMSTTAVATFFGARSSKFAAMYTYAKGGTSWYVQRDSSAPRVSITARLKGQQNGGGVTDNASFYNKDLIGYGAGFIPEGLESTRFKVPLYSRFARVPINRVPIDTGGLATAFGVSNWSGDTFLQVPELSIRNNSGAATKVVYARAAADDATLARFIGPPPVIVLNSLATINPVVNGGTAGVF